MSKNENTEDLLPHGERFLAEVEKKIDF